MNANARDHKQLVQAAVRVSNGLVVEIVGGRSQVPIGRHALFFGYIRGYFRDETKG